MGDEPNALPEKWKLLPFFALPEGVHNVTEDMIFFHLPSLENEEDTMFGVACYMQIDAKDVANKAKDVTRSSVQKSVVVLSKQPMFGIMSTKLHAVCASLFNQRDFSSITVIKECFDQVNSTIRPGSPDQIVLGLGLRSLVRKFQYRLLTLVKLMLLERKVLCCGFPVARLSGGVVAITSLIPGLLQSGLRGVWGLGASAFQSELYAVKDTDTPAEVKLKKMGLPFIPFTEDCILHPYLPLQSMELLLEARSHWVGATNALFQMGKVPIDVLVNFSAGTVDIRDPVLAAQLALTTPDLRFMDTLIKAVDADWDTVGEEGSAFVGSDAWIRVQFEDYLLRMCGQYLRYVCESEEVTVTAYKDFGQSYIDAWLTTRNFTLWNSVVDTEMRRDIPPGHPKAGEFTIQDVKLRLNSKVQATLNEEQRQELNVRKQEANDVVAEVSTQLVQAFTSAKLGFSSWLSKKRDDFEAAPTTPAPSTNEKSTVETKVPARPPPPSSDSLKRITVTNNSIPLVDDNDLPEVVGTTAHREDTVENSFLMGSSANTNTVHNVYNDDKDVIASGNSAMMPSADADDISDDAESLN